MLTDIRLIYFEPLDGDLTAAEIWNSDKHITAELLWRRDGTRSVYVHPTSGIEVDASIFSEMVRDASEHLERRAEQLRKPGEDWSEV